MYHAIIRRMARKNFEAVNRKDYDALLKACTPDIHHRFSGQHALGGERHSRESLGLWLGRLGRLMPGLTLVPSDVWVKGLPHDTTIVIRWTSSDTLADGTPYENHGVHIIRLRWGKAYEIDANEDSQIVARSLARLAEYGIAEAAAPPIVS